MTKMHESIEYYIEQFEKMIDELDFENAPAVRVMREMRAELIECGMSLFYCDQLVAGTTISITTDLNDELLDRLCVLGRKMVRKFYTAMRKEGFNDQAIALMGSQVSLKFEV